MRDWKSFTLLIMTAALLPPLVTPAAFAATAAPLQGVWRGTLGNQTVVACFNGGSDGDSSGSYYYERHKQPIHLALAAGKDTWTEAPEKQAGDELGEVTGRWRLGAPDADGLKGSWVSARGDHSLPIALKPLGDRDAACGGDAYNLPLEAMPALQTGREQEINHHRYRTLRIADVEVPELLENGAVIDKLNAKYRARLPTSTAGLKQYFETRRRFLSQEGVAATDEVEASVTTWTDHWLTVRDYNWAAGTGRQGISESFTTWNLTTGDTIDVREWFGQKPSGDGGLAALTPALDSWLDKTYPPEADCKAASYEGQGYFHMLLEQGGLHLYEEAFGNGCERDYTLPYTEIRRFLTPAGNAALTTLLGQPVRKSHN